MKACDSEFLFVGSRYPALCHFVHFVVLQDFSYTVTSVGIQVMSVMK